MIYWEYDTVICASVIHCIAKVAQRESAYAVMAKVSNKTAEQTGRAIIKALMRSLIKGKNADL